MIGQSWTRRSRLGINQKTLEVSMLDLCHKRSGIIKMYAYRYSQNIPVEKDFVDYGGS